MDNLRIFLVLVFLCGIVSSVFTHWLEDPFEDVVEDALEEQTRSHEDQVVYGPDVRDNVIFSWYPRLPQQADPSVNPFGDIPDPVTPKATTSAEALEKKLDKLMSQVKDQENEIKELKSVIKKILEKIDYIEQQTKVNNLIFFNVQEAKNENHKSTLQKVLYILNRTMKLRIKSDDISVALRVSSNSTQPRPILVRFNNFATRMRVLGARTKLNRSIIHISTDYSELVNLRRKELLPYLLEKRRQGHKAFMVYDMLLVDGKRMSLEDLQKELKREDEQDEERIPELDVCEEDQGQENVSQEPDGEVEETEIDTQFGDDDYEE